MLKFYLKPIILFNNFNYLLIKKLFIFFFFLIFYYINIYIKK